MHDKQTYNVISWLSQSQSQSHAGISVINQSRKWRRAPFCAPAWFMCFFHSVITTFSSLFTHFVLFLHLVDFFFFYGFFFYSAVFLLFFSFVTFFLCCLYLRSSAILYIALSLSKKFLRIIFAVENFKLSVQKMMDKSKHPTMMDKKQSKCDEKC